MHGVAAYGGTDTGMARTAAHAMSRRWVSHPTAWRDIHGLKAEEEPMNAQHAMTYILPIRTISEANVSQREHWVQKHKRHRQQRDTTRMALKVTWGRLLTNWQTKATITLTRIAPRTLDTDNLASALKHIRDGVADWMGTQDNDPLLTWVYQQQKGKPREYAVEITVEER